MIFIPSKQQWQKWSLPSKLTALGFCLAIISIIFSMYCYYFPRDTAKPSQILYYNFPEFEKMTDTSNITQGFTLGENSLLKTYNLNARCPCGSGKKYFNCHNPKLKQGDQNHWKGPNYVQHYYLGYKEQFNGIEFKNREKAEIILLKGNNKISMGEYFLMKEDILSKKAIVKKISIIQERDSLVFTGSIIIESSTPNLVQIILGSSNIEQIQNLEISNGIQEEGTWFGFIGLKNPPLSQASFTSWYRYFTGNGYKLTIEPNSQFTFRMTTKLSDANIFTLCLPFSNIELAYPNISVFTEFKNISMELERENIYWDFVVSDDSFSEASKQQKDSFYFIGNKNNNNFNDKIKIRKTIDGPRKVRINLIK